MEVVVHSHFCSMPHAYSYDLRQKVFDAIELDGLSSLMVSRRKKPASCSASAATPSTCGSSAVLRQETTKRNVLDSTRVVRRLLIGSTFVSSSVPTAIKPRSNWLSYGLVTLALEPSAVRSKRLDSREKKDLWLPRTRRNPPSHISGAIEDLNARRYRVSR